jgi:hypothetical protein
MIGLNDLTFEIPPARHSLAANLTVIILHSMQEDLGKGPTGKELVRNGITDVHVDEK